MSSPFQEIQLGQSWFCLKPGAPFQKWGGGGLSFLFPSKTAAKQGYHQKNTHTHTQKKKHVKKVRLAQPSVYLLSGLLAPQTVPVTGDHLSPSENLALNLSTQIHVNNLARSRTPAKQNYFSCLLSGEQRGAQQSQSNRELILGKLKGGRTGPH